MKILMVCLGNICRSPIAEGVMRSQIEKRGLDWEVDSAGTGGWHVGHAPHKDSQRICRDNGLDISGQKCRLFRPEDFDEFDHILVMDKSNYEDVKQIAGLHFDPERINLLLDYSSNRGAEVPDPYFGTYSDFESIFKLISEATQNFIDYHSNNQT